MTPPEILPYLTANPSVSVARAWAMLKADKIKAQKAP
jgi:hypothetical protein